MGSLPLLLRGVFSGVAVSVFSQSLMPRLSGVKPSMYLQQTGDYTDTALSTHAYENIHKCARKAVCINILFNGSGHPRVPSVHLRVGLCPPVSGHGQEK